MFLSGLAGAVAGLLYAGQFGSGRYDLGSGDLLTVLAAVVIGGTSLSGGRGSVEGAIAGPLLVGLVNNGVILLGFSTPEQQIFSGFIMVLAVALSGRRLSPTDSVPRCLVDSCLQNYRHNWSKICKQQYQAASRRICLRSSEVPRNKRILAPISARNSLFCRNLELLRDRRQFRLASQFSMQIAYY